MAMGSDWTGALAARRSDLYPSPAAGVLDGEPELRRLDAMCRSGEFGVVAAGVEQGDQAPNDGCSGIAAA